jgi:hypothetical protein
MTAQPRPGTSLFRKNDLRPADTYTSIFRHDAPYPRLPGEGAIPGTHMFSKSQVVPCIGANRHTAKIKTSAKLLSNLDGTVVWCRYHLIRLSVKDRPQ